LRGEMGRAEIVDARVGGEYEKFLYKCLSPIPFRRYRKRQRYLEAAMQEGFRKDMLLLDGLAVGQVEYAPTEASGLPIRGENIYVLNCIWVLRKAKGHGFGKLLLNHALGQAGGIDGLATIGLVGRLWLRKEHMEYLGFKAIDSFKMRHRTKRAGECFEAHLMRLPLRMDAEPPRWEKEKLLEGIDFCIAHPLYHPESLPMKEIYERC